MFKVRSLQPKAKVLSLCLSNSIITVTILFSQGKSSSRQKTKGSPANSRQNRRRRYGETLEKKRGSRSKGEERENRETVDEEKDTRYSRGWARTLKERGRGGLFFLVDVRGKITRRTFLNSFFFSSAPLLLCFTL